MYNFEAIPEFHPPKVEDFGPESYGFGPALQMLKTFAELNKGNG